MHPAIAKRRAYNTTPLTVALSILHRAELYRQYRIALCNRPYEHSTFVWPATYEDGIRRRTYAPLPRGVVRADCGCKVLATRLYQDPRNHRHTICEMHGNIVVCAECGQPSGVGITPETEALSLRHTPFFCSELCRANVAA